MCIEKWKSPPYASGRLGDTPSVAAEGRARCFGTNVSHPQGFAIIYEGHMGLPERQQGCAFQAPAPVAHSLLSHWGISPQLDSGHMSQRGQGF